MTSKTVTREEAEGKQHYRGTGEQVCSVFGCGQMLTMTEKLFGDKCIHHSADSAQTVKTMTHKNPSTSPQNLFAQAVTGWAQWTLAHFEKLTVPGQLNKLKEELKELEHDIATNAGTKDELMEFADVALVLFSVAAKRGFSFEAIAQAVHAKAQINYSRQWYWSKSEQNYRHVNIADDFAELEDPATQAERPPGKPEPILTPHYCAD